MKKIAVLLASVLTLFAVPAAHAIDPAAVQFTVPADIKWARNA